MAKYTVQNVYDAARSALGADATGGSTLYSNAVLQPHYSKAYRAMFRAMQTLGDPDINREVYFVLPANTTYFDPASAGLTDFGEPRFIEERGNLTQKTISGATGTTTVTITTSASHGRATGDLVTCNGMTGLTGTEGVLWGVTVQSTTTLVLNGCIGSGTYVSGGTLVYSPDEFVPVEGVDRLDSVTPSTDRIRQYAWQNEAILLTPSTAARQLRIGYLASGDPPTSTSTTIGVDDALDFLSTYTAALAARSRGADTIAQSLMIEALGPAMIEDAQGGRLGVFLQTAVRQFQRIPAEQRRRLPFRSRRSAYPLIF